MEAKAEASSSLNSSLPHLRPHRAKASHSNEGLLINEKPKWDVYFPIELITNILARLPVKTLLRFRCVSTTWRDLIENEDLEIMHLELFSKLQKNDCILATLAVDNGMGIGPWIFVNADTLETFSDIPCVTDSYDIEGYTNGLVLLARMIPNLDGPLFLWNPSIRQHFIIPTDPTLRLSHAWLFLGYDALKNDYKVVAIHFSKGVGEPMKFPGLVLVYSLRNRCWRSLSCSPPTMRRMEGSEMRSYGGSVHLRGQIYWIACPNMRGTYRRDQSWRCVSFDVCREEFSYFALPPTKRDDDVPTTSLFVLGESISLLDMYFQEIWIWIMGKKSGGRCWIKRSKVKLLEPMMDVCVFLSLCFLRRNGELLHGLNNRGIVSYNINTQKRSRIIGKFRRDEIHCEYVESLVLLRKEKGTQF